MFVESKTCSWSGSRLGDMSRSLNGHLDLQNKPKVAPGVSTPTVKSILTFGMKAEYSKVYMALLFQRIELPPLYTSLKRVLY